ncbi:MAG: DUF3800 domain-containing protein [Anaerolineales bacterium]|nr:DUF3800 domain-containing protein [Anaerolineales bacterium]
MYFFVDESGHTGPNLFDEEQPVLYYGVLSSELDVDYLASGAMEEVRKFLGVERLHAAELGMGRLASIAKGLELLHKSLDLKFDFYMVYKKDQAVISFFDQVFDQGMNPAVPWLAYWTPLRYILLHKVSSLFDLELLKKSWYARIQTNDEIAETELVEVCKTLLTRIDHVVDARSRQIITDGLTWASHNPREIRYNVKNKQELHWITPNLIGFQTVMRGIALRIIDGMPKSPIIIIDRQSQFNKTQRSLAEFYAEVKDFHFDYGTGLPELDYTGMPETPLLFSSGRESIGLELVDVYLWLFKHLYEGKGIASELRPFVTNQLHSIMTDEISLQAIEERWMDWFNKLPEQTPEQWEEAKKMRSVDEQRRLDAISHDSLRGKLGKSLD